jgi:hypothetical protein
MYPPSGHHDSSTVCRVLCASVVNFAVLTRAPSLLQSTDPAGTAWSIKGDKS